MAYKNSGLRQFGRFQLDPENKLLWFENKPVNVTLKEIEILCVLTETNELVTKETLLDRVWQDSFVEESNLSKHIYRLRKNLSKYGETQDIIQTIPKRGYRFKGEIVTNFTQELIIEKHSITRTITEEIEKLPNQNLLPPKPPSKQFWLPISVLISLLAIVGIYYFYTKDSNKIKNINTIAVAKFSSLFDKEEEKVLALGVKEKLLINLGNLKDLTIQNLNFDETELYKIKDVDAILLGNVQRTDGQVRVNLRLLQTSNQKQIWSASFDEKETDLLKLQDAISLKISESLSVKLTNSDKERVYKRYSINEEAYNDYLRGRYFYEQRSIDWEPSMKKAQFYLEKSLALQPDFPPTLTELANVYVLEQRDSKTDKKMPRDEAYRKGRELVLRALEIDPNFAEAYATLGWINFRYDWNFADAEKNYKKAIELNSAFSQPYVWLAMLYSIQGKQDEAINFAEKSLFVEPNFANGVEILSLANARNGNCEKTLQIIPKLSELYPMFVQRTLVVSEQLSMCGQCSEAIAKLEELKDELSRKGNKNSPRLNAILGYCYAVTNQTEKAREIVNLYETQPRQTHQLTGSLLIYTALNEKENINRILQEFYDTRSDHLVNLKVDPRLNSLKKEPKFKEIMQKINMN